MNGKEHTSSHLYIIALISGIIGIIIADSSPLLTPLGVILIWPAFISGANAVRQVARYGLGTGTSSIGYWGTAVGATMAFISGFIDLMYSYFTAIFGALILGAVTGIAAQKIIKMKIPVMIRDSAILASSTAIIAVFLLSMLENYYSDHEDFVTYPLIYIATTIAILHPFNGSMGAGENQKRTLHLSAIEASLTTGLFGLIACLFSQTLLFSGLLVMIISATGFLVFLRKWFWLVREETYELTRTGYPPAEH